MSLLFLNNQLKISITKRHSLGLEKLWSPSFTEENLELGFNNYFVSFSFFARGKPITFFYYLKQFDLEEWQLWALHFDPSLTFSCFPFSVISPDPVLYFHSLPPFLLPPSLPSIHNYLLTENFLCARHSTWRLVWHDHCLAGAHTWCRYVQ